MASPFIRPEKIRMTPILITNTINALINIHELIVGWHGFAIYPTYELAFFTNFAVTIISPIPSTLQSSS